MNIDRHGPRPVSVGTEHLPHSQRPWLPLFTTVWLVLSKLGIEKESRMQTEMVRKSKQRRIVIGGSRGQNTCVLLNSERMGPLSSTPSTMEVSLACTKSWLRAFYPPTSRHTMKVLHNTSVVVLNLCRSRNFPLLELCSICLREGLGRSKPATNP